MKKLDFIICGVQKSGTELLSYYLKKHPEIFLPDSEIHYFDNLLFKRKIDLFYINYHKKFNFFKNTKKRIFGEKTPIYIFYKNCMKEIYNYSKNIKIILIFRDPFDRALSHYNMQLNRSIETLNFDEAILQEQVRIKISDYNLRHFSYLERGYYYKQLMNCYNFLKKEQVLVLSYQELINNFTKNMNKIQDFLGVKKIIYPKNMKKVYWKNPRNKILFKQSTKKKFINKLLTDYVNFKQMTKISFYNFENFKNIN